MSSPRVQRVTEDEYKAIVKRGGGGIFHVIPDSREIKKVKQFDLQEIADATGNIERRLKRLEAAADAVPVEVRGVTQNRAFTPPPVPSNHVEAKWARPQASSFTITPTRDRVPPGAWSNIAARVPGAQPTAGVKVTPRTEVEAILVDDDGAQTRRMIPVAAELKPASTPAVPLGEIYSATREDRAATLRRLSIQLPTHSDAPEPTPGFRLVSLQDSIDGLRGTIERLVRGK